MEQQDIIFGIDLIRETYITLFNRLQLGNENTEVHEAVMKSLLDLTQATIKLEKIL